MLQTCSRCRHSKEHSIKDMLVLKGRTGRNKRPEEESFSELYGPFFSLRGSGKQILICRNCWDWSVSNGFDLSDAKERLRWRKTNWDHEAGFIIDKFDKFKNERRRTSKYLIKFKPTISEGYSKGEIGLHLYEAEGMSSLSVKVDLVRKSWMFLDKGKLIFLAGGENITLKPGETSTSTVSGGTIMEIALYPITKEQLKTLCDAESWEVQLSGGRHVEEVVINESEVKNFRQFYNQVYDNSLYPESLTHPDPTEEALALLGPWGDLLRSLFPWLFPTGRGQTDP